jgi:Protein of unknown function (DUF3307)
VTFGELFVVMLFLHCLADYPLQGDFMAKAKNAYAPIPGVPWWQAMSAHAVIQGCMVTIATGSPLLGFGEAVVHFLTDHLKCAGALSYSQDQAVHVGCKAIWAWAVVTAAGWT